MKGIYLSRDPDAIRTVYENYSTMMYMTIRQLNKRSICLSIYL